MKRYMAFLRGINISGKNKVSMAELKIGFERLGFESVRTYMNSGNVIFSSDKDDIDGFRSQIETMVKKQFGLDIPVFVISQEELEDILHNAPVLWSSIFVTLMANKIGGLQFGIYRNCQISSRVFHTAVAALPLTKANRSDFE